ncbi:MAG TPA: porin family protein [Chitinophagaceae bacterium]
MKKVITVIIGIGSVLSSFSQLSVGIQGTGNLSDASIEASDFFAPAKKARVLPGAGIVADIKVNPSLMLRTGLNYQQQGIKLNVSFPGVPGEINEINSEAKLNLHYVQLPLNVLYTTKGATSFYAGGGPYVSFALSGKSKTETTYKYADGTIETETEEGDIFEKDEDGNTSFKRTDFGLGALAGVKFPGGFFANVGYQFSLANLSKDGDSKYRNRGLQLTIGYYLFTR